MNDQPQPLRILLGQRASDALTEAGGDVFVCIGRGTTADPPNRWILHLVPCSIRDADKFIRTITKQR